MTSAPCIVETGGIPLVLIRHGTTDWNEAGLIQGRSDRSLSEAGRRAVAGWLLPESFGSYRWQTSPLARARETAALLGRPDAAIEPAVVEMHWGGWEGWRLDLLREREGAAMARNEARGLDFRPPGGESPRDVQRRLQPWLQRLAREGQPSVAVSHKGVIRALYALASGWDMTGKSQLRQRPGCYHIFRLEPDGRLRVVALDVPMNDQAGEG